MGWRFCSDHGVAPVSLAIKTVLRGKKLRGTQLRGRLDDGCFRGNSPTGRTREEPIHLRMSDCKFEDEPSPAIRINHVGDYAEFVFFEMGRCAFHLDIKCRQLREVYNMKENDRHLGGPFLMVWPPTFPVLKDDPARCPLKKGMRKLLNGL